MINTLILMNSGSLPNFSKEKELIHDIAKKIDSQREKLSGAEINKLISFSVEACSLICQRTLNPTEKEYYFNLIKLLNEISREYNVLLLQKYLRIILFSPNTVF